MRANTKKKLTVLFSTAFAAMLAATGASALATTKAMADETDPAPAGRVLYYVNTGFMVTEENGTTQATREQTGHVSAVQTSYMAANDLSLGTKTGENGFTGLYNSKNDKPLYTYGEGEVAQISDGIVADDVTGKGWGFSLYENGAPSTVAYGYNYWRIATSGSTVPGYESFRYTEGGDKGCALGYKFEVDNDNTNYRVLFGTRKTSTCGTWGDSTFEARANYNVTSKTAQSTLAKVTTTTTEQVYTFGRAITGVEENGKKYITLEFGSDGATVGINWIMIATSDYATGYDDELASYSLSSDFVTKGDTKINVTNNDSQEKIEVELDSASIQKINNAKLMDEIELSITVNEKTATGKVWVLPADIVYFQNVSGGAVGDLILGDTDYSAENGHGLVSGGGEAGWTGDPWYMSVRYDGEPKYQFDLDDGVYGVVAGSWANNWGNRTNGIKINDVKVGEFTIPNNSRGAAVYYGKPVDGSLTVQYVKPDGSTAAPMATYIIIYEAKTEEYDEVTYDVNGGEGTLASDVFVKGQTFTIPAKTLTREHYDFSGWYTEAACTNKVTSVTESKTLYAGWTPKKYTVTFNSQVEGIDVASAQVDYNTNATAPGAPTREGYNFEGWYKEAACTTAYVFDSEVITGDITLYAKWAIKKFTVTFDAQNDTTNATAEIEYNGKATKPETDPTKEGYVFVGWYKEAACTNAFDFAAETITENTTIYAKWAEIFTITFNSKGGSDVTAIEVGEGLKVTEPDAPTKTGYAFIGWYYTDPESDTEAVKFDFERDTITENTTLYAKWEEGYTITFVLNGGAGVKSLGVAKEEDTVAPADPTRTGYTFEGWYKEDTFTTKFTFGGKLSGDITLYANWTPIEYTVTLNAQNGSENTTVKADYDTKISVPAAPAKTGHTFGGWYKEAACTTAFDFESEVITGDITLYAKWTLNTYTVTFNSNEGSAVDSVEVTHGGTVSKPEDPAKEGYTFGGWLTEDGEAYDFDAEVTGDLTLVAKWTEVSTVDPLPTPEKPKGCKSSISASLAIVGGMLAIGTAAIVIKKRKSDK